ncbi:hypothetical protein [Pyxidicoccus xibeiensis]|uniref:hypothetical protein n=1 Tax=Pyxidicoccus xibeiensis TaxID=2906759 RepID=UPI0020A80D3B|nr:hypothetical protein [Pyxidicoccus xibeiensis]MCP3140303.1 hypothetical protein [Pyxidicoccus xibeiensis]
MRAALAVSAFSAVAVSGAVALVLLQGSAAPAAVPAASQGEELRRQLEALRRDVSKLEQQLLQRQALATPPPLEPTRPPAAPGGPGHEAEAVKPSLPRTPEELAQRSQELVTELASHLEERLETEPLDRDWSSEQLRRMEDAIRGLGRTQLLQATCGSTLCRVVVGHESTEDQQKFSLDIEPLEPFHAGVFFQPDEQARTPRTTLYVLRKGHRFNVPAPSEG